MTNPVALITGAKRGIGLGAAIQLAKEGFSLAINDLQPDQELAEVAKMLRSEGIACMEAPFDVADIECHSFWIEKIKNALGPITTLINNAGVSVLKRGDPLDISEASWDRCHAVNAKGLFFLSQKFAHHLLQSDRAADQFYSIINITSSNAVAVAEPRTEYAVSKAAAAMASKALAVRLGRENIHVYDVQPGLVDTDMTSRVIKDYSRRAEEGLTLIPRISTPDEVGITIASLATGRLPYVTGQTISVDGGLLVPRY